MYRKAILGKTNIKTVRRSWMIWRTSLSDPDIVMFARHTQKNPAQTPRKRIR